CISDGSRTSAAISLLASALHASARSFDEHRVARDTRSTSSRLLGSFAHSCWAFLSASRAYVPGYANRVPRTACQLQEARSTTAQYLPQTRFSPSQPYFSPAFACLSQPLAYGLGSSTYARGRLEIGTGQAQT